MSCGRFVENFARIPEVGGSCVEILALNLSIQMLFGHCLLTLQRTELLVEFSITSQLYLCAYSFLTMPGYPICYTGLMVGVQCIQQQ